uniref:Uncharacterized protein n=1 Tax=Glossina palpalis gambiensis TaxID=67801 RepID=A0A1B0C2P8_9MUSC
MQQVNCQNVIKSQPPKYLLSVFNTDELIKRPFFSDITDNKGVKNANADGFHIKDKKIVEVVRNSETENNSFQNVMTTLNSSSLASHDSTQYIPLRNPYLLNVADRISNETVNLESNTSLDEDIQGPNETLNDVDTAMVNRPHTAQNSSYIADKSSAVNLFANVNGISSFHESENDGYNPVDFSSQEFVPGELMLSNLKLDEISCTNGFVAIRRKLQTLGTTEKLDDDNISTNFNPRVTLNSATALGRNHSIGNYFGTRSNMPHIIKNEQNFLTTNPTNLIRYKTGYVSKDRRINSLQNKDHERNGKKVAVHERNGLENKHSNDKLEIPNQKMKSSKRLANTAKTHSLLLSRCANSHEILKEELPDKRKSILKNKENLGSLVPNIVTKKQLSLNDTQARAPLKSCGRNLNSVIKRSKSNSKVSERKETALSQNSEPEKFAITSLEGNFLKSGINNINALKFAVSGRTDSKKNGTDQFSSNHVRSKRSENANQCVNNLTTREKSPERCKLSPPTTSRHCRLTSSLNTTASCPPPNFNINTNSCLLTDNLAQTICKCTLAPSNSKRDRECPTAHSHSHCSISNELIHRDFKKLLLQVTRTKLSWKSTKLRTNSRKKIKVKNASNSRLVLRTEVSGPGFQIFNKQDSWFVLDSQECRLVVVNFCPTICGVAVGKVSFYDRTRSNVISQSSLLDIPLYGYGGHVSVILDNIVNSPVGCPFIPMGRLSELDHPLERTISIRNKGPLEAFVVFSVNPVGFHITRLDKEFKIEPKQSLIAANSSIDVRILFHPKREQVRKISRKKDKVVTLANVRVSYGDEASRQRVRRLIQLMSQDERSKMFSQALETLWTFFPGEVDKTELDVLRDNPNSAIELISEILRVDEILLTLNNDLISETLSSSTFFTDFEDTNVFHTVYAVNTPD